MTGLLWGNNNNKKQNQKKNKKKTRKYIFYFTLASPLYTELHISIFTILLRVCHLREIQKKQMLRFPKVSITESEQQFPPVMVFTKIFQFHVLAHGESTDDSTLHRRFFGMLTIQYNIAKV